METQSEELGSVGQRLGLGPGVEPQLGVEGEVLRTVAARHWPDTRHRSIGYYAFYKSPVQNYIGFVYGVSSLVSA